MRELIFIAIGLVGSLGFGLYRMRDRLGKFMCEDDDIVVTFDTTTGNYRVRNTTGHRVRVEGE